MIQNPDVSVEYELSFRDFVAGQKLACRTSPLLLLAHVISRFIALGAAFVLLCMCAINIAGGHGNTVRPILPLLFLILLLPVMMWSSWRFGFKRLKVTRDNNPQMTFQADRKEFVRRIDRMGEITWLWSATRGITVGKKIIVIAVRRGAFIYIPRQAISDGDIALLKSFLQESKKC